jgi:hypothetical protein
METLIQVIFKKYDVIGPGLGLCVTVNRHMAFPAWAGMLLLLQYYCKDTVTSPKKYLCCENILYLSIGEKIAPGRCMLRPTCETVKLVVRQVD